MIAGGLENGTLEIWNAESLINGGKSSTLQKSKHSAAIKCLEFNPTQKHVLATGGTGGKIYVWDLNNPDKEITPGKTPSRKEDVEAISWNCNVAHILASGSSTGTSIWDLKNRKEVLHLSYSGKGRRCPVSSIAWHPGNSTKLISASSDESCPVVMLWDLRNANSPLQIMEGHDKGVLSIDWCKKDPGLLLSSGKDNRTFLWDTTTGSQLGEYPVTASWTIATKFCPHYPDIFASTSLDGTITIQTLQDVNSNTEKRGNDDDSDFWNCKNYADVQHPIISLSTAPKWLKRPASVTFGFGGKIVSVATFGNKSKVSIAPFVEDKALITETTEFATALKSNSILEVISERLETTNEVDRYDWELLEILTKSDSKTVLKDYLSENTEGTNTPEEAHKTSAESLETISGANFLSALSIADTY